MNLSQTVRHWASRLQHAAAAARERNLLRTELADLAARGELDRALTEVGLTRAQLPTLPPDAGAERALVELARSDVNQLAVIDGRKLLGLVRREDLVRWLDIHEWMTAAEG